MAWILTREGSEAITKKRHRPASCEAGQWRSCGVVRQLLGHLLNRTRDHDRTARRRGNENVTDDAQRDGVGAAEVCESIEIDEVSEVGADDAQRLGQQNTGEIIVGEREGAVVAVLDLRTAGNPRAALTLPLENHAM